MAKKKTGHPIQQALGTCHSTMSAWCMRIVDKRTKGSRSATSGFGKIRYKVAPEGGWPGGMPEQNGWKPGGAK